MIKLVYIYHLRELSHMHPATNCQLTNTENCQSRWFLRCALRNLILSFLKENMQRYELIIATRSHEIGYLQLILNCFAVVYRKIMGKKRTNKKKKNIDSYCLYFWIKRSILKIFHKFKS